MQRVTVSTDNTQTHPNTSQSVGLLRTKDRPFAETSTRQQISLTKKRYRYPPKGFEPAIPASQRPLGSANLFSLDGLFPLQAISLYSVQLSSSYSWDKRTSSVSFFSAILCTLPDCHIIIKHIQFP